MNLTFEEAVLRLELRLDELIAATLRDFATLLVDKGAEPEKIQAELDGLELEVEVREARRDGLQKLREGLEKYFPESTT